MTMTDECLSESESQGEKRVIFLKMLKDVFVSENGYTQEK